MKGKIVSYDPQKGVGKIITKKYGVKLFNIDDWIDYNKLPEVGIEVEYDIENNHLKNILTLNSTEILFETFNKKIRYKLPENLQIKENVTLDYCLDEFFNKFKKIALKYKNLLSYTKSLPYKKVKRFLLTAYNNLLEIDLNINDSRLRDIKNSLDEVEKFYDKLKIETKNPIYIIMEKLVLTKQQNYQLLKTKFENNKTIIGENSKNINLLELKIEKLNKELDSYKKSSAIYQEKLQLLKFYKKNYVDLIDNTQKLKEQNSEINSSIKEFEEVYQKIFEKIFKREVYIILKILEKELDILASQFDTILWENAKLSKEVQNFFKKSKIEGSYSTKTFIKYYLKSLNKEKMNNADAELVKIFDELKVFSKNIIIYDKNKSRAREILLYLENLDYDAEVKIFNKLKEFIFYIKENDSNIDIIIFEKDKNEEQIILKIKPILEKIGIEVIEYEELKPLYKKLRRVI